MISDASRAGTSVGPPEAGAAMILIGLFDNRQPQARRVEGQRAAAAAHRSKLSTIAVMASS
jgi:hypothetical protein